MEKALAHPASAAMGKALAHSASAAGKGPPPDGARPPPTRYLIRNGILIDRESYRDDPNRQQLSFLSEGSGSRQQLSPLRRREGGPPAVQLDRVMPTPIPPSELPDEWHIYSAQREKRAFNLAAAASLATGQSERDLPKYRVFPSTMPSSRSEVLLLQQVLERMLERVSSRWEEQADVYDVVLSELVRQVMVACSERGQLLGIVRQSYARLMRMSTERIGQLERTARRLRDELAASEVAAAQRIAQSKALSLDEEHAARKSALLERMRATSRYETEGLHLALDAYARMSEDERVAPSAVLVSTKLERAQAAVLAQALLATLPAAEGHALLSEFIAESVSSHDLVLSVLPERLQEPAMRVLVQTLARGGSGEYDEGRVGGHVAELLMDAEEEASGASARILASGFDFLNSAEQRIAFLRATGLAQSKEEAEALLERRATAEPSPEQLAKASLFYSQPPAPIPHTSELEKREQRPRPGRQSQDAMDGIALPGSVASAAPQRRSSRRQPPSAAELQAMQPMHSVGAFAQCGMILVRGRTVDETAGHVIKSSALLSLEQTLKECGELLLLRQDSNLADALVGGPCSSLPALLDFWAFGKHTRRSAARAALSSLAASVHHHSTYTQ
eukprot:CAMPEP_0179840836 /NCGR_PEP_ID=MMETSP0982-20121206/2157_1 /TAXON_ID=483367 /ORGANISM="non described non described, Strain CCMP 2436" /LENGTH=620 /DNA_ID=CAMNT_0021724771 /DNA_START=80 /DNA_END=1940 /DNA_ORIENTATION=+